MMQTEKSRPESSSSSSLVAAGGKTVAGEQDLNGFTGQIVLLAPQQLNGCPRSKIRAADAHHHQHLGLLPNPLSRLADALQLRGGHPVRQRHPAQIVRAAAGPVGEPHVRVEHLPLQCQKRRKAQFPPDV